MALGLALAWRGYAGGGALLIVVGALASGVALGLLVGALGRQAVRAAAPGPGIVAIDEGRIGYLGPRDGGYVDLPTLVEVALVERAGGAGRAWVLRSDDGTALEIPLGAVGAERLPDALAALPGFDLSRGVTALARPGGGTSRSGPVPRPGVHRPRPDLKAGLPRTGARSKCGRQGKAREPAVHVDPPVRRRADRGPRAARRLSRLRLQAGRPTGASAPNTRSSATCRRPAAAALRGPRARSTPCSRGLRDRYGWTPVEEAGALIGLSRTAPTSASSPAASSSFPAPRSRRSTRPATR
jgi:hypothetical protein